MQDRLLTFPEKRCDVLLVDDARDSREMYAFFLRGWGYGVHEAIDGGDAVAIAVELRPDVDRDGPGPAHGRRVHRDRRPRGAPGDGGDSGRRALRAHLPRGRATSEGAAGAAAFLGKPCHPDLLASTVRAVSGICDEAMAAATPLPAPRPPPPPARPSETLFAERVDSRIARVLFSIVNVSRDGF